MKTESERNKTCSRNWLICRFIPALGIVTILSCLFSWIRSGSVFVPGIQGMIAGGIAGWVTGVLGRKDADKFRTFSQRIWLCFTMTIIYGFVSMTALSIFHGEIIDPPLYWLEQAVNGFEKEPFLGIGSHTAHSGMLGGGWWIFFNLLDFALFAFLFLVFSGVGSFPDHADHDRQDADTGAENVGIFQSPESSEIAFRAFVSTVAVILIGGFGYWYYQDLQEENPYSTENLAEMNRLAGTWEFEKGGKLFGKSEDRLTIRFEVAGFNTLRSFPDQKNPYMISIDKQGNRFSGNVYLKGRSFPIPVRARFSSDGKTVIMVFTLWDIHGRKETTITGRKIGNTSRSQIRIGNAPAIRASALQDSFSFLLIAKC